MTALTRVQRFWIWWHVFEHGGRYEWSRWLRRRIAVIRQWLQGCRRPKTGGFDELDGELCEDGLEIAFGGGCPVQGEGTLDGLPCYYRSRGNGWQFHVAPRPDGDVFDADAWVYEEYRYVWPDGGWVTAEVSTACIRRAVAEWRKRGAS